VNVAGAMNNYIFGFTLREVAWEQLRQRSGLTEDQWSARLDQYVDEAEHQDHEIAQMMATRIGLNSADSFDFGLECLLNGVAARLSSKVAGS